MSMLEIIALLTQLLIPIALIGWVGFRRRRSRLTWALDVLMTFVYLIGISVASQWLALPWYLPAIFAVALAAAATLGWTRIRLTSAVGRRRFAWLGLGARALLTVVFAAVTLLAVAGRQRFPEPAADIAFPLQHGTYLVANGGSREIVNPHIRTLTGERYRDYRGQSFAVDIVKVGSWGSRRAGFAPVDPARFAIFGDSIYAPCSGTVVQAADGFPDRLPDGTKPRTLEGNHVMLECGDVWILLAHMKQASVRVTEGEAVAQGDVLGLVGNSGSSGEPHLHIHAQMPGTRDAPLSGDPIPVAFAGRHLVRNDRVRGE